MIVTKNNYDISHFHNAWSVKGDVNNPEYQGRDLVASRHDHLKESLSKVTLDGEVLEFGVFSGSTINVIAKAFPNTIVHGFDSFEGLPESWDVGNRVFKKGHFARTDLPKVESNVKLWKGWFCDTIPNYLKEKNFKPITFLHIDCDLYSSTTEVLNSLESYIIKDTIIVFDDFYAWGRKSYNNYKDHEYKALHEWITKFDKEFEVLSHSMHQQTCIKITK